MPRRASFGSHSGENGLMQKPRNQKVGRQVRDAARGSVWRDVAAYRGAQRHAGGNPQQANSAISAIAVRHAAGAGAPI